MAIELKNASAHLRCTDQTGAVESFYDEKTGWEAVRCPSLSRGLSLVYRSADGGFHYLNDLPLASCQQTAEDTVRLTWTLTALPSTPAGQTVQVAADLTLSGRELSVAYSIDNDTDGIVDEVRYPSFGGYSAKEGAKAVIHSLGMNGNFEYRSLTRGMSDEIIWPEQKKVGLVMRFPSTSIMEPFELIQAEDEGMYIGFHNSEEYHANFHILHEVCPGYADSLTRTVPEPDDARGQGLTVCMVVCAYLGAHEKMTREKAVFRFYDGDWHKGVEPYREWRKTWFAPQPVPSWFDEVDCWMTLHINSSAGCVRYRYKELPEVMREAKEYGVKALQLIGWATGGQDGHEPYQDPDDRLGTREELVEALREIRQMGIKVLPMCKWRWFDEHYPPHTELVPYIAKDKFQNGMYFGGYSYQTAAQHLLMTIHDGWSQCHLAPDYRKLCLRELDKIFSLGADGIMYDEFVYPESCYAIDHGHRPGDSCWTGGALLAKEYYEHIWQTQEALFCGEGVNDYLSQYYACSYIRSASRNFVPALRYINEHMKYATCLTGLADRGMVNQCIAFGYIINYEPYNFKGRLRDAVKTGEYANAALKMRMDLRAYLWDGTYTDTVGGEILNPSHKEYIYTIFNRKSDGKKAMVIVNESCDQELTVGFSLEGCSGDCALYTPEEGHIGTAGQTITLPPSGLVVVVDGCLEGR